MSFLQALTNNSCTNHPVQLKEDDALPWSRGVGFGGDVELRTQLRVNVTLDTPQADEACEQKQRGKMNQTLGGAKRCFVHIYNLREACFIRGLVKYKICQVSLFIPAALVGSGMRYSSCSLCLGF